MFSEKQYYDRKAIDKCHINTNITLCFTSSKAVVCHIANYEV